MSPRAFGSFFFLLVALLLLVSDRGQIAGDGIKRWEALHLLMSRGELSTDKYSLAQPLVAAPLYGAADAAARVAGMSGDARLRFVQHAVKRFNKLTAFCIALWMYHLLRAKAKFSCRGAALSVLFLLFGSLLIPHARDFYSEPLWTLFSLGVITMLVHLDGRTLGQVDWRFSLLFVVALSLLVPLNPLLLFVFGFLGLFLACRRIASRSRNMNRGLFSRVMKADLWLMGTGLTLGVGLCFVENGLRRGNIRDFGYPGEGFSTPFLTGFTGLILSPTRGMLWYMPAFLCGFALVTKYKAHLAPFMRRLVSLSLVFCCLLLLAYSKWHAWHGAWYWGPRFLLPLSLFGCLYLALIAKPLWKGGPAKKGILVLLVLFSYMIHKVGVGIGQDPLIACLESAPDPESCYWRWRFSPMASWLKPGDLARMLTHRSTAVELVAAISVFFLWRKKPENHTNPKTEI